MINPIHIKETFLLGQEDFNRFADLSGDHNPIHVDPEYSSGTRFGATVSHGMLLFTVVRGSVQRHFPEHQLIEQQLMFPAPAYADETLTLLIEGAQNYSAPNLELKTRVLKADGNTCLEGYCRLETSTGSVQ
ncbi:MAG: MaoC family dehydratase [Marinobacter sp.]